MKRPARTASRSLRLLGGLSVLPILCVTAGLTWRSLSAARTEAAIHFTDVTTEAGISFTHHSGAYGAKLMPETVGSGLAFLDYDGDGRMDLLFVDGAPWPGHAARGERSRPSLYHNEGGGRFRDETANAGLAFQQYGMGAAVGDFDNDGHPDLFLTAIGPNHLFRNRGNGTFEDVTAAAGVAGAAPPGDSLSAKWSSSAAWLDYDRDGKLDLLVLQYVKWTIENDVWCGVPRQKVYCPPTAYEGVIDTLYRNLGGGKFRDVTADVGLGRAVGKGFGVAVSDFNGDGWPDFAVSNDTQPDFLFVNEGGKRFHEGGYESGMAVGESGKPRAGMGIDAADWNNDGRFGLLIGNFSREGLALYRNDGAGRFEDEAYTAGLGVTSQLFLTFGAFFSDFDNDGWLDAFAANGHIDDFVNVGDAQITYEQRPLIYRNMRGRQFREVGATAGASTARIVARGAAPADYDNDGDPDVALVWNNHKGLLWRNDAGERRQWLGLMLQGTRSNRDGIGAVVRVRAGGVTRTAMRRSGGSFLSERDPRMLFGLDRNSTADIEVAWPSGLTSSVRGVSAGAYYRVVEGEDDVKPENAPR